VRNPNRDFGRKAARGGAARARARARKRVTVIQRPRLRGFTCPRGSKKIKQRALRALVALTLVAPRDLLRGQYDSVSGEFDEELMVL